LKIEINFKKLTKYNSCY